MYSQKNDKKKFIVFAIEVYRSRKCIDGETAIGLFEKTALLNYIEEFYDVLHSNGVEYLIDDFDDYFKSRNMDDYNLNDIEKETWRRIIGNLNPTHKCN